MTVAVTREAALETLESGRRKIEALLARLTPAQMLAPGIGGGEWSPKDLLGHLALWQEIALRTITEFRRAERPWIAGVFSTPGPGPNDDELAARAPWSFDRALEAYSRSWAELVRSLRDLHDSEWLAPADGEDALGELLGVVLGKEELPFGHAFAHIPDLESFVEERATTH
ncbi:MAG: DinB family protein [Actinobacteria bacterium]|nr:DinB family protein [Actinomycetota bacterium]